MVALHTTNEGYLKPFHKCPKCKKGELDTRVPRSLIVKHLFFWLDVKRYRCNNCHAKVYIKTRPEMSN